MIYGTVHLQRDAIEWIESDVDVDELLGEDGGVVPVAVARESDADPRVAIATSLQTGSRENDRDGKTFEIRAIVDGSIAYVNENGTEGVTELKDTVTTALTEHRPGFYDPEVQSDEEIAFYDPLNRYMGVVSVTVRRVDAR